MKEALRKKINNLGHYFCIISRHEFSSHNRLHMLFLFQRWYCSGLSLCVFLEILFIWKTKLQRLGKSHLWARLKPVVQTPSGSPRTGPSTLVIIPGKLAGNWVRRRAVWSWTNIQIRNTSVVDRSLITHTTSQPLKVLFILYTKFGSSIFSS